MHLMLCTKVIFVKRCNRNHFLCHDDSVLEYGVGYSNSMQNQMEVPMIDVGWFALAVSVPTYIWNSVTLRIILPLFTLSICRRKYEIIIWHSIFLSPRGFCPNTHKTHIFLFNIVNSLILKIATCISVSPCIVFRELFCSVIAFCAYETFCFQGRPKCSTHNLDYIDLIEPLRLDAMWYQLNHPVLLGFCSNQLSKF